MTAFREQNLPERALMRPDDSDGFREAWSILERRAGPGWSTSRSRNVSASFSTRSGSTGSTPNVI